MPRLFFLANAVGGLVRPLEPGRISPVGPDSVRRNAAILPVLKDKPTLSRHRECVKFDPPLQLAQCSDTSEVMVIAEVPDARSNPTRMHLSRPPPFTFAAVSCFSLIEKKGP
jgi:hypothetical protein